MKYLPDKNAFTEGNETVRGDLSQVVWHINSNCKCHCPFCFKIKTTSQLNPHDHHWTINLLKALGVKKIDITGGEPLLYKYLQDLVKEIQEAKIYQTITTTGLGNKKNNAFLVKNSSLFTRIIVSLDAPFEAEHIKCRGNPLVWKAAIEIINALPSKARKEKLRINTVVGKKFIEEDWASSMVNFIDSVGGKEWCIIAPQAPYWGKLPKQYQISNRDFIQLQNNVLKRTQGLEVLFRPPNSYLKYWLLWPNQKLQRFLNYRAKDEPISLRGKEKEEIALLIKRKISKLPKIRG